MTAITFNYVQVAPPGGGQNMECVQLLSGSVTVLRQITTLGDPVTESSVMAVKPASTAPVATDCAAVVTLSPNTPTLPVSLASLPALPVGSAIIGKVGIDQTISGLTNAVTVVPTIATTSALTPKILSAAGAATAVKASAGNLYGFSLLNNNAAVVWVEFFNTATPTLGVTTPICAFPIPASGALSLSPADLALANFSTAIYVAAVTAYNGASTGSVSGTIFYQ